MQTILTTLQTILNLENDAVAVYNRASQFFTFKGYTKLADIYKHEIEEELGHARNVTNRILFLEGTPTYQANFNTSDMSVIDILKSTKSLEDHGRNLYRTLYGQAMQENDGGTADLAQRQLVDTEDHYHWADTQLKLIDELGLQNYLQAQL